MKTTILTFILALVALVGMGQSKKPDKLTSDTLFFNKGDVQHWNTGIFKVNSANMDYRHEVEISDGGKLVALIDSGKWHVVDTMATIRVLYQSLQTTSDAARRKSDLYYMLIDIINTIPSDKLGPKTLDAVNNF